MSGFGAPFPSGPWFDELVERAMRDEGLARLGIADLRFGIEILAPDGAATFYGLVLDGYDIRAFGPVDEASFDPEVVVSGPVGAWSDMIGWIEANGAADSAHSLNGSTIAGTPLEVRADDPMGSDKFYRYMGTLQAVFDAAGTPAPAAVGER